MMSKASIIALNYNAFESIILQLKAFKQNFFFFYWTTALENITKETVCERL